MTQQYSMRWLVGGVVALAAVVFLAPLLVGAAMGWGGMTGGLAGGMAGGMWGPMHGGWTTDGTTAGPGGWWWVAFAAVWRLLLLAVLVGGGYLLYRAVTGDGATGGDSAIDELRSAYARGDLSDEEYERRRERLEDE